VRRHRALEALSRDHHRALVVARELKRADGARAPAARDAFLAYWDSEGREHFREEEEILLPACAAWIDPGHPLVARVLTDHVRIRELADRLDTAPPERLHDLGRELEQHVRREERELFPLIEETLPDEALQRLVERLV
jgi:iron-sulfur cluster repair protein YtfE (RIC family)